MEFEQCTAVESAGELIEYTVSYLNKIYSCNDMVDIYKVEYINESKVPLMGPDYR